MVPTLIVMSGSSPSSVNIASSFFCRCVPVSFEKAHGFDTHNPLLLSTLPISLFRLNAPGAPASANAPLPLCACLSLHLPPSVFLRHYLPCNHLALNYSRTL